MTMAILNAFCFGISVPLALRHHDWWVFNVVWPLSAVTNGFVTIVNLSGFHG